jgi:hypothetical protein
MVRKLLTSEYMEQALGFSCNRQRTLFEDLGRESIGTRHQRCMLQENAEETYWPPDPFKLRRLLGV